MKSLSFLRLVFVLAVVLPGAVAVRAQDLGAVKARMEQRLGAVDGVKDRGAAGENNRGYLEARAGANADDQKVIAEENADRRTVYAAIGAQTGSDADTVGKARARQIANNSKAGVWVQAADGSWAQKR